MPKPERHLFICAQTRPPGHPKPSCGARGGGDVLQALSAALEERDLLARFRLTACGCLGACESGAVVLVYPEAVMYGNVTTADVAEIIESHLLGGTPVERLQVPAEVWG